MSCFFLFSLGSLITMLALVVFREFWPKESFMGHVKYEYKRIFNTQQVPLLLTELKASLDKEYSRLDDLRERLKGVSLETLEEHARRYEEISREIEEAHASYDHALGLALVAGHGRLVGKHFRVTRD